MPPLPSPSPQTVRLAPGRHAGPHDGACLMELSSMLAGESFTDRPASVSPAFAAFLRGYHDHLDPQLRGELHGLASDVVGTRGDDARERERARQLLLLARRLRGRRVPRFGAPDVTCEVAGMLAAEAVRGLPQLHEIVVRTVRELAAPRVTVDAVLSAPRSAAAAADPPLAIL
ncbi:MAG TPA: hypothetical protein VD931_05440 [Baekduia sp.]|nr:hypothetical protein [Baekduia sp.]